MLTPMNDDESCAPWTVTTAVAVMAEPNRCYQWPVLGVIGFSMQPRMLPSSAETVVLVSTSLSLFTFNSALPSHRRCSMSNKKGQIITSIGGGEKTE